MQAFIVLFHLSLYQVATYNGYSMLQDYNCNALHIILPFHLHPKSFHIYFPTSVTFCENTSAQYFLWIACLKLFDTASNILTS